MGSTSMVWLYAKHGAQDAQDNEKLSNGILTPPITIPHGFQMSIYLENIQFIPLTIKQI